MTAVTALFDGAERTFEISRDNVSALETSFGRSLYAILKEFIAGHWTFDTVAAVVSFALHGPPHKDKAIISLNRHVAKFGAPVMPYSYRPEADVLKVLERDGHGNFVGLATEILTAAIFGDKAAEAVS